MSIKLFPLMAVSAMSLTAKMASCQIIDLDKFDARNARNKGPAAKVVRVVIEKVYNDASLNSLPLQDQVITGTTASFKPTGIFEISGEKPVYLQYTFMGQTSAWFGPLNGPPAHGWNFDIPRTAIHKLNEPLTCEARIKNKGESAPTAASPGRTLSRHTSNIKVLFDKTGIGDDHNRAANSTIPNWFLHWASNQDNAVPGYSTVNTTFEGIPFTVQYGGVGSGPYAETIVSFTHTRAPGDTDEDFNAESKKRIENLTTATTKLFQSASGENTANFDSPAYELIKSTGVHTQLAKGKIKIHYSYSGIDLVANIMSHERMHVTYHKNWAVDGDWRDDNGIRSVSANGNDADGDILPNTSEDAIGTQWDNSDTFGLNLGPSGGGDDEVWIQSITQGNHECDKIRDWSFPGKQSTPLY